MDKNPLLIVFIKNPVAGKVKTRLARDVGNERALEIYKQLLDHTHDITSDLPVTKHLYYSEYLERGDIWEIGNFEKFVQQGNDLGTKMSFAFEKAQEMSFDPIIIIGSDCFELTENVLLEAFEKLNSYDFVIGPAEDGGYYLIGMNSFQPELFEDKTYSTSEVLEDAIKEIDSLGKKYFLLPKLSDIDTLDDLNR